MSGVHRAVDLRSDTVTQPTAGMRRAMAEAAVGDDVFGDDPTVNRLQAVLAERFGKEAALFFPTGSQSNLAALMAHCARGEEVILGQDAHAYRYEAGSLAVLGSIQPQPLENQPDGSLALADIAQAIKPDDPHFAVTRCVAIENTIGGKVLPRAYLAELVALARRHGLATHLDGARIFNAATKLGMPLDRLCDGFDTVSVCLSKGLGTPAGTVLVGSRDAIARAHRIRKLLGGAMRQVGVLAAAGLYALEHHVARLAEDHANAERLAHRLVALGRKVDPVQTNMVFLHIDAAEAAPLAAHLEAHGVKAQVYAPRVRLVTHLDVEAAGIDRALDAFARFFGRVPAAAD